MTKSLQSVSAILFLAFQFSGDAIAADAAAATPAKPNAQCESRAPEFGDKRDVTCVFPATGANQRLVFRVNFLGSHDDTELSMTASLNQQELTCDPGSKMSSRFEDGEISLECRFSVKAAADAKQQVLEVGIVWTHAQYANYELTMQ